MSMKKKDQAVKMDPVEQLKDLKKEFTKQTKVLNEVLKEIRDIKSWIESKESPRLALNLEVREQEVFEKPQELRIMYGKTIWVNAEEEEDSPPSSPRPKDSPPATPKTRPRHPHVPATITEEE